MISHFKLLPLLQFQWKFNAVLNKMLHIEFWAKRIATLGQKMALQLADGGAYRNQFAETINFLFEHSQLLIDKVGSIVFKYL